MKKRISVICAECGETVIISDPVAIQNFFNGLEILCGRCEPPCITDYYRGHNRDTDD